jgi:uncharacterized membrane protein YhaH (DUF805 family)
MNELILIIIVAVIFGVIAFIFSNQSKPSDRAKEAIGAAAAGATMTFGCLVQFILFFLFIVFVFWIGSKIFGY